MIKIIDDFFEDEDLKKIQDFALNKAHYVPKFFFDTAEKTKENFYGNKWHLDDDQDLKKLFIKQAELKFKLKINHIAPASGIDQRNLDHWKPHQDKFKEIKTNILIMLSGPTAVSNGTVFYYGTLDDCVLDIHVGFRENRAILFPSDWIHSPHVSNVPNLKRYTASLFLIDYEEV